MRQIVDFVEGSDTGESDNNATNPIVNGDRLNAATLNRPAGNLRGRSEELRIVANQSAFLESADRNLLMYMSPTYGALSATWDFGDASGTVVLSDAMVVVSSVTPGTARGEPGVGGSDHASRRAIRYIWDTGTRAASQNGLVVLANEWAFQGANEISLKVTVNPAVAVSTPVVYVTGSASVSDPAWQPGRDNIEVVVDGTSHSYDDVVAAINGDGVAGALVTAYWEAGDTPGGSDTDLISAIADGKLQGGLDGEHHKISAAELAAFFAASSENHLKIGDTLAVYYPTLSARRGSVYDIPNGGGTYRDVLAAQLVNLSREPEKSQYALPILKVVGEDLFMLMSGETFGSSYTFLGDDSIARLRGELTSGIGTVYISHTKTTGAPTTVYNYLRNEVEPVVAQHTLFTANRRFAAGDNYNPGNNYLTGTGDPQIQINGLSAAVRAGTDRVDTRRVIASVTKKAGLAGTTALSPSTLYYVYSTASGVVVLTTPVTAVAGDVLLGWFVTPSTIVSMGAFNPLDVCVWVDYTVKGPIRRGLDVVMVPTDPSSGSAVVGLKVAPGYIQFNGEVFYVTQNTTVSSDINSSSAWAAGTVPAVGQYGFLYANVSPDPENVSRSIAQPISSFILSSAPPGPDGIGQQTTTAANSSVGKPCLGIVRRGGGNSVGGYADGHISYHNGRVSMVNPGTSAGLASLSSSDTVFDLIKGDALTDVVALINGGAGFVSLTSPGALAGTVAEIPADGTPDRIQIARADSMTTLTAPVYPVDVTASSITSIGVQSFRYLNVYGAHHSVGL